MTGLGVTQVRHRSWEEKTWLWGTGVLSRRFLFDRVRRLGAIDQTCFLEFFASDHLEKTALLPNRSAMVAYGNIIDGDSTNAASIGHRPPPVGMV